MQSPRITPQVTYLQSEEGSFPMRNPMTAAFIKGWNLAESVRDALIPHASSGMYHQAHNSLQDIPAKNAYPESGQEEIDESGM